MYLEMHDLELKKKKMSKEKNWLYHSFLGEGWNIFKQETSFVDVFYQYLSWLFSCINEQTEFGAFSGLLYALIHLT